MRSGTELSQFLKIFQTALLYTNDQFFVHKSDQTEICMSEIYACLCNISNIYTVDSRYLDFGYLE